MAVWSGLLGGILRAAVAFFLISGGLLLSRFEELVESYREAVENAPDANALLAVLEQYAGIAMDMLGELWRPLLIVIALWVVSGSLLSRAWGSLDKSWPRLTRVLFKLLGALFMILALIGLLVPARFFLEVALEGLGGLLEYFGVGWVQQAAPFLIVLPMSLPVFKALISFRYSEGRGKLGSLLLVAGGVLYLVAAYQVFTTYRLGTAIVTHVQALFSQGLQAESVLREASLTLADLSLVFLNRVEGLLFAILGASLLYAAGFALHKPRAKGGEKEAKAKKQEDKEEQKTEEESQGDGDGG